MATIKITAEEASRHKAKKQIEDQLKQYGEIKWEYSYATLIKATSFNDILNGARPPELTAQERLEEFCRNTTVSLCGKVGRRNRSAVIEGVPDLIVQKQKEGYEQQEKEQAEFDSLSEEEQEKEMQKTLAELRKYPGFMEIQIPRGRQ